MPIYVRGISSGSSLFAKVPVYGYQELKGVRLLSSCADYLAGLLRGP